MGFEDLIYSVRDLLTKNKEPDMASLLRLREACLITIEAIGKDVNKVSPADAERVLKVWKALKKDFPEIKGWYDSKLPFWENRAMGKPVDEYERESVRSAVGLLQEVVHEIKNRIS